MSIRLPGTMKKLFVHQENWWRFYEKEKDAMRPAIVDNVIKMLSCGLLVRGYAMYSCGNEGCAHQKKCPSKSALQLQEPVLPSLRKETHRPVL